MVPRPAKKSEYVLKFATKQSEKGWRDLVATIRNPRWQHKPTQEGTARVWFYVDGNTVYLEQVHTAHPNQTK
ncbi:hypothetical protein KILIM_094_00020 [Kineosphaera limosa NBRC 100340]|uniref:Uncharacterized protein n=1 Tax=Kineosphaera limosa NBRC 100340 TaxID=1184609 RepID=K6X0V4_9MICO|nr:hypothetical protein KILIM_094_00020 [Kineosphaera limosa NBRC 100340]